MKKILVMIFTIMISFVMFTLDVKAKVQYVLINDQYGITYRYDYKKLKASYALETAIYNDYSKRITSQGTLGYYDDVNNFYVSSKDIKLAYINSASNFFMDDYTSSNRAKKMDEISNIKEVSEDSSNNIVVTDIMENELENFEVQSIY